MEETILIVDDEAQIRTTLRGVLSDEGYHVLDAEDGVKAMDLIAVQRPQLVILDIWMPHLDGIAVLEQLKIREPELPIIIVSGHGTIETAVRATKLGAADFLEKPFSVDTLLRSVRKAMHKQNKDAEQATAPLVEVALAQTPIRDQQRRQARTIAQSVVLQGQGLHSGARTGIILQPLPPGSGILFNPLSDDVVIPAAVEYVESTGYATCLRRGGVVAKTVEHLLSALHGYGIINLLVKMQGEIPILDGSAVEFCQLLDSAGFVEQLESIEEFVVDRTYIVGDRASGKFLQIEPADRFEIQYTLIYPDPVGRQDYRYLHQGAESYRDEIAPARTFGFLREIRALEEMGLANGGRLNNCILIGDQGVINPPLRFPDELVRHKILDLIGDLYLLGCPLRGKITACRTGHTDNVALVRTLRDSMDGQPTVH